MTRSPQFVLTVDFSWGPLFRACRALLAVNRCSRALRGGRFVEKESLRGCAWLLPAN